MSENKNDITANYLKLPIQSVLLELTSQCNKNCSFCYQKNRVTSETYINDRFFYNFLKFIQLNQIKKIIFSGGEPFLHKKIWRYADLLKKNNISILIITNGTLLDDRCLQKIIKRKNISLRISVELNNSEHILNTLRKIKKYSIVCDVAITLYKNNLDDIVKAILNILKFDIPIQVSFPMFKGNAKYSTQEVKKLKDILKNLIYISINKNIQIRSNFISALINAYFLPYLSRFKNCLICKSIKVDIEGNIFACPYFLSSNYIIGNINQKNYIDSYISENIQKRVFMDELLKCSCCKWNNICPKECIAMDEEGKEKNYSCEFIQVAFETLNNIFQRY